MTDRIRNTAYDLHVVARRHLEKMLANVNAVALCDRGKQTVRNMLQETLDVVDAADALLRELAQGGRS